MESETNFGANPEETKELPKRGAQVNVYFFRHAEALGQGREVDITENGKSQAREAARSLYKSLKQSGGLVKFVTSPVKRCIQTAEIMEEELARLKAQEPQDNLQLMRRKQRTKVGLPGVGPVLKQMGIETDQIDYWLEHPDVVPEKTPTDISKRVEDILKVLQRVADRVKPDSNITYVYITHEPYHGAVLNKVTGKTLKELGGDVDITDPMKVQVVGNSDKNPQITFRDVDMEIDLGKSREN